MSLQGLGPDTGGEHGSQAKEEDDNIGRSESNNEKFTQKGLNKPSENYEQRRKERRRDKRRQRRQQKKDHIQPLHKNNQQYDSDEKTWGDEPKIDKGWMTPVPMQRMRIMHMNTNGITSKQEYVEWETLLDNLNDYQTDI